MGRILKIPLRPPFVKGEVENLVARDERNSMRICCPPLEKEGELHSSERVARGVLRRNARVARDGNPGRECEAWIAQYSCNPGLSGEAG